GTPLVSIGSEDSEQLKYVPAQLQVVRHHRLKYACPHCHQYVVTADRPKPPIPKSVASPSLLAGIAVHKYADALPLYRQETIFARLGITLDRTNLAHWMVQAGQLVQPLINLLGDQWAAQPVVHMDETPVQVLHEPGKPAQSESWMWVRASAGDHPVRLFDYAPTRAKTVPLQLLTADTQVLMVDGYSGYAEACDRYGILRLGCWAHCRRKFVDAQRLQPKGKTGKPDQALAYIAQLYRVESGCRDGPPEQRYAQRQQHSKPILDQLHAWLEKTLPTTPPKTTLGLALTYLANQWPRLTRYLEDGCYPIDNQLAENSIRPFAVGRRNWLFCNSQAGARASANLYSLIETAKANGLNPQRYLERVFTGLPNVKTVADYEALLPWHLPDPALETSRAD
ncbi:MAG: IS66 family transposase, partial [Terriglobales bacterium]